MIRVEIELSAPAPADALRVAHDLIGQLGSRLSGDAVVHRIIVEEADA